MDLTVSTARDGDALIVLFAEDDTDTREMYELYFSGCGLIPELASDGPEAVAKALRIHPDVIVLDITLPYMDGFDVCRAIKRDPGTSAIPVIAATGYWRQDTAELARDAGFESFLLKPCAPSQLLEEIRRVAPTTARRSSLACPLRKSSLRSVRRR
jgi:two-component system cell cycle response regulator DivK